MPDLIVSGPDSAKLALTFDMGSVAGSTKELLEVLKSLGVKSTFFVTGQWVDANPTLLQAVVSDGHEIANHSYSHPDFTTMNRERMLDELNRTEEAVRRIANVSTKPFWRPPFGAYDKNVLRVVGEAGYKAVYWTLDSSDWREDSTAADVVARVTKYAQRGGIIVMHGAVKKTADALPSIIPQLRAKGLNPTTVSDLLARR